MTTIAWDGSMLAVDRLACMGGTKRKVKKLHDCGDYAYAGAGNYAATFEVAEWLRNGAKPDARPTFEKDEDPQGIAIHLPTGKAFMVEGRKQFLIPVDAPHAEGTGRDAALAAMWCGRSAAEAVAIASEIDVSTGGGVDLVCVGGKEA